jgi:hypothetical protein
MRLGLACAALAAATAVAPPSWADARVSVDAAQSRRAISPLVYGMAFPTDAQIDGAAVTVARWGGNSTSRYNHTIDVHNTGADWFFENVPGCFTKERGWCKSPPKDAKAESTAHAFLRHATDRGLVTLFTVPTLGWVSKGPPRYRHPFACGCPKRLAPAQNAFDPYDPSCGDGKPAKNGKPVDCAGPEATSERADPAWVKRWVEELVATYGPSNGRRVYALDNEPSLWSTTHRDVRTQRLGYDELWERTRDYATAILDADPTAEIAGPAEWGWPAYFCSDADDQQKGCSAASPDRAKHGGQELVAWLLDRAREHEGKTGRRLLHWLDLHYYPQADRVPENVRTLWDPSYRDPSWVNDVVRLVPRMRAWVAEHYPGTKTLLGEYDFHHHDEPVGAVTYAEVLGVLGREGIDLATAWAPPAADEAAFSAYRLYRDFDGHGGRFESTSVRTIVDGAGVAAFASVGKARLTIAMVAEAAATTVRLRLAGFRARGPATLWLGAPKGAVVRGADVAIDHDAATIALPAASIAMLVVDGEDGPAPAPPSPPATAPAASSAPTRASCALAAHRAPPSPLALALAMTLALALRLRARARAAASR